MTQRDRKQKSQQGNKKEEEKKNRWLRDIQHAQKYKRERGVSRGGGSPPLPPIRKCRVSYFFFFVRACSFGHGKERRNNDRSLSLPFPDSLFYCHETDTFR